MAMRLSRRAGLRSQRSSTPAARAVRPLRVVAFKDASAAAPKAATALNQLEALKKMTVVVADTGDVALVKKYKPQDCTTNPSLVLKAVQSQEYEHHLGMALKVIKRPPASKHDPKRPYAAAADVLAVNIGAEMLKIVPGRVSTEVDAHLSYDTRATVDKALHLIDLYSKKGIDPKRVYIKIASTWEGIEACRQLQKQGIDTNMTLLFSFAQAAACADAGATLISPFVGRILDWHKASTGQDYTSEQDPGVLSVKKIYNYYKTNDFKTIVMAASFRNAGEIRELAGCDNITIAPSLLAELEASNEPLARKLFPDVRDPSLPRVAMSKEVFYRLHNEEQMAVDKLKQGVEGFAADQDKLEAMLAAQAAKA